VGSTLFQTSIAPVCVGFRGHRGCISFISPEKKEGRIKISSADSYSLDGCTVVVRKG
jgi:hypothetical protein